MILKLPNKISYAPLMLGLGVVSSLIHFIIHPQVEPMLLFRESLFPFLFALLLFMVMNVMQQNQESENAKYKEDFSQTIVEQIDELKRFVLDLETRMLEYSQEDRTMQENIREKFKNDIKLLDKLQSNQMQFLSKFDEVEVWHKNVTKEFENFIEVQIPQLDKVVHKHIDMLRVSEKDHFNHLKEDIKNIPNNSVEITKSIEELKLSMKEFQHLSSAISKNIVKESVSQLSELTQSYKGDIITLKSHAEGMKILLFESENKLSIMKIQTDEIAEKMLKSSQQVEGIQEQNNELYTLYVVLKELLKSVEEVKSDYIKSETRLINIVDEFEKNKVESSTNIEQLQESLIKTVEESIKKLEKHYTLEEEDIRHNVQILSQKAKVQKEYTDLESDEPVSNTINTF
jgi:hypothetical protein